MERQRRRWKGRKEHKDPPRRAIWDPTVAAGGQCLAGPAHLSHGGVCPPVRAGRSRRVTCRADGKAQGYWGEAGAGSSVVA